MDSKELDKTFYSQFSTVIVSLMVLASLCVLAASIVNAKGQSLHDTTPLVQERTAPLAVVITDPAALVAVADTAKAERAPMTGEEINTKICAGCHASGVMDAPKTGDKAAWSARFSTEGGLDGLVSAAIHGKNAMPPKGGDSSLSDDEVHATVEFMLKQAGL